MIPDVGGEPRVLVERDDLLQKVFPGFMVTLHRDEAEGYYLNVSSGEPCVFVSIRADEEGEDPYPFQVTASYNEAARWMDGGERVDPAAIDREFAAWIGEWVEAELPAGAEGAHPAAVLRGARRAACASGAEGWPGRIISFRAGRAGSIAARTEAPAVTPADAQAPLEGKAEPVPAEVTRPAEPLPLPAVETLTPESDFTPFMAPDVDGRVRRQALKTLFSDPHFNVHGHDGRLCRRLLQARPDSGIWMGKLEPAARLGDRAGRDRRKSERQGRMRTRRTRTGAGIAGKQRRTMSLPAEATPARRRTAPAASMATMTAGVAESHTEVGESGT